MGGWQSRPAGPAPRLTAPEIADNRDLFAKYTTLEDHLSPHEQAASVNTEMSDRGEDTTMAPTASCSMSHSPTLPMSENASTHGASHRMLFGVTVPSLLELGPEPSN